MAVSFTDGVKPHLAVKLFDYNDVRRFVLAGGLSGQELRAFSTFGHLRDVRKKCSDSRMPWDIWLIFLVLGLILPWRGRARMKKLLALPQVSTMERLILYASTIAFQWFAVAVVAWRAWANGLTASQLGLTIHDRSRILVASVAGAAAIATLQWLNLRRVGRLPVEARGPLQAIAERILPQSSVELLPYLALAITAGLCEEFLYRGFAMAVLTHVGLQAWAVVLLSSALFGLAHSYQGRGGIVMTMLIGVILGVGRITFDSLIPVIFWHSAVDLVAGTAGPRYLTAVVKVTSERVVHIH
jgi:membrane protease YdiL (CAAX protease family)